MLKVERDGSVLRINLDRPQVRNAFDETLIARLREAFENLRPDTRVVVLGGEGKAFCAGGDLEWMRRVAQYGFDQNVEDARRLTGLFEAIQNCPALVIARVHGFCSGGGCGLVAAADVAVAAADAQFSFPEVKMGLIPATIAPFVVPKIGVSQARALFTSGETFDADRALRINLVHEVVVPDKLNATVAKRVEAALASSTQAVAGAKRLITAPAEDAQESARRLAESRASDDAKEGIAAFLEKRLANFAPRR
jgi:enoyl-CoA hydratase/carnithine racemase